MIDKLSIFFVEAQGLIPDSIAPDCEGMSCNIGHLIALADNILNLIIGLTFFAVLIVLLFAGFNLLLFPDDPSKRSKNKSLLRSAFIGLILAVSSWLIFNLLLNALGANVNPLDPQESPTGVPGDTDGDGVPNIPVPPNLRDNINPVPLPFM